MTANTRLRYDPNANYEVVTSDIVYRREGELQLPARMYLPQGPGPFPAVVDVHGGAWAAQSHVFNAASHEALARSGVVVMAIDFRSSNLAPHPAAMEDISYAIRWLKAHASEFSATAEGLGVVGWSSGGQQVMLGAMRPEAGDEATQERENPVLMLERGVQAELPPVLVVQGSADEALPRMLAERFVELYSLAGGVIELGKYPGAPHGFMREPGPNTDRAQAQICQFISRQLASA
jgi:acetyl esterase/lipase